MIRGSGCSLIGIDLEGTEILFHRFYTYIPMYSNVHPDLGADSMIQGFYWPPSHLAQVLANSSGQGLCGNDREWLLVMKSRAKSLTSPNPVKLTTKTIFRTFFATVLFDQGRIMVHTRLRPHSPFEVAQCY